MSRFNVLEYNQAFMSRLGIYLYQSTNPVNEFLNSFPFFFNVVILIISLTSSAVFVVANWPRLDIVLEPCLIFTAFLQSHGMYFTIGFRLKNVMVLHLELQRIVDEGQHDEMFSIYWGVEQKCRKYSKIIHSFVISNQSMFVASFLNSLYNILIENFETSTWLLPFQTSVPFNTDTIGGWYVLYLMQFSMGIAYSTCISSTVAYFVCCCLYIGGICDQINFMIRSITNEVELNQHEKNPLKFQRRNLKIKQDLCKLVESIVNMHKCSDLVANINSGSIFSLLPPNVLMLAFTLYNTENSSSDIVMIVFHIICATVSFAWPFLYCYFATLTTERISSIAHSVYDSNWFDYPPELKRIVILNILRSQKSTEFSGFGLIGCNLEVLGNLINNSCSYYLIFRKLSLH